MEAGGAVWSVGKIDDIFAHRSISHRSKRDGLAALWDGTLEAAQAAEDGALIFTNFVDFDSKFGHRRLPEGYAEALEYWDSRLPALLAVLREGDLVLWTADHGNDPPGPGPTTRASRCRCCSLARRRRRDGGWGRRRPADMGRRRGTLAWRDLPTAQPCFSVLRSKPTAC